MRRPLFFQAVAYEVMVALLGWGVLLWLTSRAEQPLQLGPIPLYFLLAMVLKREGFRVAGLVTHSLAGIAVLAAAIVLGPLGGSWVAALSGSLFLASRPPRAGRPSGPALWRLILFAGGLNTLVALGAALLYAAVGGRWAPASLQWRDLLPTVVLSLAWFAGDHLGWCVRIGLEEGLTGLERFLRAIRLYSVAVELLPLPLAAVVAASHRGLGAPALAVLSAFLVAVGEVLRRLNLALARARERVADLVTLNGFSQALLASKLDVTQLCALLRDHTAAAVDAHYFWLGLFDERSGDLRPLPASAGGGSEVAPGPGPGLVAWMRKHRAPLLIRDAEREVLPFDRSEGEAPFRSGLLVPLQATDGLSGLLAVGSPEPDAYNDDDLRTVVTFANQTAMAMLNARSYEAEQRRARQIATVGEVSRRVVAILGMERLFSEVVNLVRDAFGYYHVQLFTVDPAEGGLAFRASTHPAIQEQGLGVAPGQGLIGWVAETGEQAVVDDVSTDPRYRAVAGLEDARSEVVLPLKVDERLVGILDVMSERPKAFGPEDLFVLQTLADQVAIAIDDNRLYRAEKHRRQVADTLREIAAALNSTLELRAVLDLVLTQLQRVIRYNAAAILEWRDEHYCIVAGRGRYAEPDRCLTANEEAQLLQLTREGAPFVFDGAPVSTPEAASLLAAPLVVKGRLVGALLLERRGREARYVDDEVGVAAAFANQAAAAIENARLYEAEQRRARQLAAIAEVGQRVASILELDELFGQVVQLVREQFGYYNVSIFTVEPETGLLVFRASTGTLTLEQAPSVRPDEGIIGWVAAHGESLLANDVTQEPRYVADEALPETRSELAVPLQVEGRTVGVLDIQGDQPGAFGAEDLFIMQTLADQVAVAIENARLYAAQQEEAWVSTALLQVAETLANLIGLDEVLDSVIRLVPLLVGLDRCFLFARDEGADELRVVRAHGLTNSEREAVLDPTLAQLAPEQIQALVANAGPTAMEGGEPESTRELLQALAVEGGLALPLRAGGETVGLLVAGESQPSSGLSRNRRAILTGIANQAAMAIQNAHLYIAQRQEAWVSTALLQVAELAGRTRDLDEILASLVRLTPMLAGVKRCCVFLWDRNERRYTAAQEHGFQGDARDRLLGRTYLVGDFPLLDRVRETGERVAVDDAASSDLVPGALAESLALVSVLALPLRSQAEVLGVMLVDYGGRRPLPQQRVDLLSGIANEAAIAIENVQLYRESLERERIAQELRLAYQIQATFLPESYPSLPGWSIAATSRPAREVGGDFYDFVPLGASHLGVVIADVSDKGVPAALFMAVSRTVMRAVAIEGHSPAAALARANDLLLADSRSGMFVTVFYGLLDRETGELAFASAGHNPPYWYRRRDGELVRLASRGVALGVVEDPVFEEGRIVLQPGDTLTLYTDGVSDSLNPDQREFGEAGLESVLRMAGMWPARRLVAAIDRAVESFSRGAPQFDDYTLLAISRDG